MRRFWRQKTDQELLGEYKEAREVEDHARQEYIRLGGYTPGTAEELAKARVQRTVAQAEGKNRLLGGGHRLLQDLRGMKPSPKKKDSLFGKILRRNRGTER